MEMQIQPRPSCPLYQMAKYLDAQLAYALHNPAAEEENILRLVDRYAEVLSTLQQTPQASLADDRYPETDTAQGDAPSSAVHTIAASLDRPEIDLFMVFILTVAAILSVLYMI